MHLNKLGNFARNLIQNPRIVSYLNFTRNRNDSSSFFNKTEHNSQGNSQPRRKVMTSEKSMLQNFLTQIILMQTSTLNQTESFVSSLKNFSRRVRFYDRDDPADSSSEFR